MRTNIFACVSAAMLVACGDGSRGSADGSASQTMGSSGPTASAEGTATESSSSATTMGSTGPTSGPTSTSSSSGGLKLDVGPGEGSDTGDPNCPDECSADFHQVLDCNGMVVEQCMGDQGCDPMTLSCQNACDAAANNKQSVGCEYYPVFMDTYQFNACFAAFVANTWDTAAHITVEYNGQVLPVQNFAYIPNGVGPNLMYDPFDANAGIPPGEVVILFLSGPLGMQGSGQCPLASAIPNGVVMNTTGIGNAFRIESDVPVVAYEISPYGGGSVAVTGASLLLPTSVWDDNYIAINAYQFDLANPSMNIVAQEDNTTVTMVPVANVIGGGGIPAGQANQPMMFTINEGQHAQLSQAAELTGSVIMTDKPVGLMAGHACMRTPFGVAYCDHGEQMVPPIQALGHRYVGVMHRPRVNEPGIWRMVGALDDTQLTWTPDVGGPATLQQGQIAELVTTEPFHVESQDEDHPFLMFNHMSGSTWQPGLQGYGDVDFVINYPPDQYMQRYVFFADPTYPETNLVVVRRQKNGQFFDVDLDCAGVLGGWQSVGDYEWTRVDLITGDFMDVGNCSTGRHEISSAAPFGLWVWGWGTPETSIFTQNVSYGYPAGMNVQPINDVVIPPQ